MDIFPLWQSISNALIHNILITLNGFCISFSTNACLQSISELNSLLRTTYKHRPIFARISIHFISIIQNHIANIKVISVKEKPRENSNFVVTFRFLFYLGFSPFVWLKAIKFCLSVRGGKISFWSSDCMGFVECNLILKFKFNLFNYIYNTSLFCQSQRL